MLKVLKRAHWANTTPQSSLNKPALPSLPPRWSVVNWEVRLLPWWLAWTNHRKVMSCFQWAIYEETTCKEEYCHASLVSCQDLFMEFLVNNSKGNFFFFQSYMDLKIQPLSGNHNVFKCWEICASGWGLSAWVLNIDSLIGLILQSNKPFHFTCEVPLFLWSVIIKSCLWANDHMVN